MIELLFPKEPIPKYKFGRKIKLEGQKKKLREQMKWLKKKKNPEEHNGLKKKQEKTKAEKINNTTGWNKQK